MKFSIVTPSFRNSQWLKLCIASVADQAGVEHEHIVQDACSDDGTQDWLPHDPRVQAFIEKDEGMYDAINRGFQHATGDVFAYLNCDEQYLPGALSAVRNFFERHPEVDIVLPDLVIVNADGSYRCHRYSMVPLRHHLWMRNNITTSSLFWRRRVQDEVGLRFDPQWRAVSDFYWIHEAVERGVRFAELRFFASAFTETGENLALQPNALREIEIRNARAPRAVRAVAPLIVAWHRWRLLTRGVYWQASFSYELYTLAAPDRRTVFNVPHPTAIWRRST